MEDMLQIPEVSFIREHPLTDIILLSTNKISSTESNRSGLCYCAAQHSVNFLLTMSENLDLKID